MIDSREVRDLVVEYLHERPMSFEELARRVGIQSSTLRHFMHGKRVPRMDTLLKIMRYIREN